MSRWTAAAKLLSSSTTSVVRATSVTTPSSSEVPARMPTNLPTVIRISSGSNEETAGNSTLAWEPRTERTRPTSRSRPGFSPG